MIYHVSLKGFSFMAYQRNGKALPEAVRVEDLRREVTPGERVREDVTLVETTDEKGKTRVEKQKRVIRSRVTRQTVGHPVRREVLEVEANSPEEAKALFGKAMARPGHDFTTAAKFKVLAVSQDGELVGAATGAAGKPTADEAARELMGGRAPVEE